MTSATAFLIVAALLGAGAVGCRIGQEFATARARKRLRYVMALLLLAAVGMALEACVAASAAPRLWPGAA